MSHEPPGQTPGTSPSTAQTPAQANSGSPAGPSLPPPRWWCRHPCPPYDAPTGARRIRIPIYGWFDVDDDHRTRVERFFHVPMLVLALLVLPLLLLEWYYGEYAQRAHPVVQYAILSAGVVIWLAFLIEFTIKVWIAPSRWQYVTRNWLDIVIIALPLLRPFRALRVVRAVQVARVSRTFTLRGVVVKLLRTAAATVLGLKFVQRMRSRFRKPVPRASVLEYEEWSRACLIAEVRRLERRVRELEKALADRSIRQADEPRPPLS